MPTSFIHVVANDKIAFFLWLNNITVRTGHGTTDWFQIGKGVRQRCMLSPCLFNLYAEYIMRNAGLHEHKLESDCWEKYQ